MADRVAALLDYENVLRGGWELYGRGREIYQCVPEPSLVADAIGVARGQASTVTAIYVFRGRPDPRKQPLPGSANDRQAAQWVRRDPRVRMVRHPLAYRGWPRLPPVEKGVDVALAIELVRLTLQESQLYEALVVFSGDTDLRPALDLCRKIGGPVIEVACWDGAKSLQIPGTAALPCHDLGEADWRKVIRDWSGRV